MDLKFRKELDRINTELELEREIASASGFTQIQELFGEAATQGEAYAKGYQDGSWKGRELLFDYLEACSVSSRRSMMS